MIYFSAVVLGLVWAILALACEVTLGNVTHLENGREANAGAAVFPTIPVFPLLFVGFAWGIKTFVPAHDLMIFSGVAFALIAASAISLLKLNSKLKALKKTK